MSPKQVGESPPRGQTLAGGLEAKLQFFRRELRTNMGLPHKAAILYKFLQFLGRYHGVKVSSILEGLDENLPVSLSKLRLKYCNQSVVDCLN